jgi:hypothetical protein
MKDQITWEDAELFDYINKIEYMYVPDIDDYQYLVNVSKGGKVSANARKIETPVFGCSEIVAIFKNRYNEGKLMKQNLYKEYRQTAGHLLKDLELDAEKFWCLFLFALDYCNSIFYEGLTIKATPMEQLQALVDMISDADNESMLLNFKAGKKKMSVESPVALRFLADAVRNQLETTEDVKTLSIREQEEETKQIADSPIIVYFAKILLSFFNTQEHIKLKRKKGANFSAKEMDLVGQLVYFSDLSRNESWTEIENETLKAFLKQYKDYQYPNNISSVYPEFVVY